MTAERIGCGQADDWILDAAGPAGASSDAPEARHVAACARCSAALDTQRTAASSLGALRAATSTLQAPAELQRTLGASFAAQARVAAPGPQPSRSWWLGAAALAAAATLAFLATRAGQHPNPEPTARVADATPAPSPTPAAPGPAVSNAIPVASSETVHAPRPRPRRRTPSRGPEPEPQEVTTAFVRLPYAEALPEADSLQVVRVELPRSALVAYGWPASDLEARPVRADLMVGDDGMARAIRFVSR